MKLIRRTVARLGLHLRAFLDRSGGYLKFATHNHLMKQQKTSNHTLTIPIHQWDDIGLASTTCVAQACPVDNTFLAGCRISETFILVSPYLLVLSRSIAHVQGQI